MGGGQSQGGSRSRTSSTSITDCQFDTVPCEHFVYPSCSVLVVLGCDGVVSLQLCPADMEPSEEFDSSGAMIEMICLFIAALGCMTTILPCCRAPPRRPPRPGSTSLSIGSSKGDGMTNRNGGGVRKKKSSPRPTTCSISFFMKNSVGPRQMRLQLSGEG
eukprot:scaffold88785_cov33-Phaeocystis_antarctica.AAC.1